MMSSSIYGTRRTRPWTARLPSKRFGSEIREAPQRCGAFVLIRQMALSSGCAAVAEIDAGDHEQEGDELEPVVAAGRVVEREAGAGKDEEHDGVAGAVGVLR